MNVALLIGHPFLKNYPWATILQNSANESSSVVYFDQLLGAARTQKPEAPESWSKYTTFLFLQNFFSRKISLDSNERCGCDT